VAFRDARRKAEADAGGGKAIDTLLAKAELEKKQGKNLSWTEDEIANLNAWSNANAGYISLGATFADDERDDPDGLLSQTTAKLDGMDAKMTDADNKQKEVARKEQKLKNAKANAEVFTARASELESNLVEASAKAADQAADEAIKAAEKIPKCAAKAASLRHISQPGENARPAGIDIYGNRIPRPGAPGSPGGPSAPAGHGGGPEGP